MTRPKVFVLAFVTFFSREALADTKAECVEAHESSQLLRRQGKLRATHEKLLVCSQDACPDILRLACTQWLEQVEASTPTIVLQAHGATETVSVAIDGASAERLDGRARAIDPGEHFFHFTSGSATRDLRVVVSEGQKNVPVLGEFGEPPKESPRIDLAEIDRVAAERSQRTVGFVVGGIGAAAVVTGVVFGLLALSAADDATCRSPCPARVGSSANPRLVDAEDAYDRSHTFAWVSNIALGAGIVGFGLGTYFVLTAGKSTPRSAWIMPGPGSVAIGGAL